MEKVAETWVAPPKRPTSSSSRQTCLVHIYPTGMAIGARYTLSDKPLLMGRGEESDIRIPENSVSRKHALIEPSADGFTVKDLGSTNGTFVNDTPTNGPRSLHDGDYLRIGNCIYRYLAGGNVEAEYHEEIYRLTIIDALTQTHNQRYLLEFLDREVVRSNRHDRPLSLVMFDIDWFKKINDEFGHLGGDFALRELANVVRHSVRREDLFARYGGEEFALVLVETDKQQALEVAERIRASVEQHKFTFDQQLIRLTISLGVADCSGPTALTASELIKAADERLYQAKRAGRNRVVS
ncbi:GGDEF domain-containing protein [Tuwongella immobilis]|uniref:diguanylate cyclase n=1 Tax=Tuwongella immobilis TaxID=692036 RepID=A0A6C2YUE7_9BACT|nr:GGDEF domain-containing protein [Tuwongella immobilis]VIP05011.1 diguanylate cyclase : Diguanylate cyclase (GGDEF) domain-containing protein OS=Singulisphaera acidiphila (strain ATCC BAA-1392 / DSM 18658 / VKM B-2454 / MOB10) GN=Sinac_6650 PE=4 SV=1: FHA: GGDEF [Tuwongella immobilis]VTS07380.1 diguanylate cyclase : Diguanylate cyclase (GGDEF) domain-containing protein OS=Singulisphaera acidiphila (strain ATCC BAA-1392 / DSM 18658 / VKM B-2454 / MOB10) GN=Sinac_6650 PE=4 SV=1: FHA: GGDEF [Tuwon